MKLKFKQHLLSISKKLFLSFLLICTIQLISFPATATDCLIGGQVREKINGRCSTRNNSCSEYPNGFLCGAIFNGICIPRQPINTLSNRCQAKSDGQATSQENFDILTNNDPIKTYCINNPSNSQCKIHQNLLTTNLSSSTADSNTEANAVCLTGECPGVKLDTNFQEILRLQNASENNGEFNDIISDLLYARVQCKNCSRHDGCALNACFNKAGSCRRKRSSTDQGFKSTSFCAGYVAQSLNIALRKVSHCDDSNIDPVNGGLTSYAPEICKYNNSTERSICNSNFVLPSALCALNLDGVNRINKNTISNRSVRRACNGSTTTFPTHYNGIPLFKEISDTIDINDPDSIPTGAIVVMKSGSQHGHIEIKTNNKKCTPVRNKNRQIIAVKESSTCFCSDFCTERDTDDYGRGNPFQPQAVFQINPELLQALEAQEQQGS